MATHMDGHGRSGMRQKAGNHKKVLKKGTRAMRFSNTETLAVVKWMVRTRLMETLCEPDPRAAFDRKIKDDFAELVEAGAIAFGEATHDDGGIISIRLHRERTRFVFKATVADGRIEIERRAECV